MNILAPNASNKDIGEFMVAMRKDAGTKADIYCSIYPDGTCSFSLYPSGLCFRDSDGHNPVVRTDRASDWEEASTALIAQWNATRSNHRSVTVRKMALEIIQITADQGECTDRALRLTFDQSEIDALGAEAADLANEMASNGPFSIKATAQANAA